MKIKDRAAVIALALIVVGATSSGAGGEATSAPSAQGVQAGRGIPVADAPLTREQILEQGPAALEMNCTACHLADKWEGTYRNRDGWVAIVTEMSNLMTAAQMPQMSDETFNLIVDYLALTRPQ